jgi:hypothetical protein
VVAGGVTCDADRVDEERVLRQARMSGGIVALKNSV